MVETKKPCSIKALQRSRSFKNIFDSVDFTITSISKIYRQQLTHQIITGQFIRIKIKNNIIPDGYHLASLRQIDLLPFPKLIRAYLED